LLGKTKLENELRGLSKASDQAPLDPANTLFRGIPKAMADRVNEVLLEITPSSQLARIVLTEVDGASTEFRFTSPKEDLGLSDALFQFTPPAGVETIEGSLAP
jgi:outer membrane lipoprotein-sorting protein